MNIADSLINISDEIGRAEEALKYLIQAYVILETMLNTEHSEATEIRDNIAKLGKRLSYGENILEKRLAVQSEPLQYRFDDLKRKQESDLIADFNL